MEDSSVGEVSRLRTERLRNASSITAKNKIFSSLKHPDGLLDPPSLQSMGNGDSLPGGKAAGGEDDRSFPSSSENTSACTPPLPHVPSGRP
jgi:hypothetical protein